LGGRNSRWRHGRVPRQGTNRWRCASTGQGQFGVDERGKGRPNVNYARRLLTGTVPRRREIRFRLTGGRSILTGTHKLLTGSRSLPAGTPSLLTGARAIPAGANARLTGARPILTGKRRLLTGGPAILTGETSILTGDGSLLTGKRAIPAGTGSLLSGGRAILSGAGSILSGERAILTGGRSFPREKGPKMAKNRVFHLVEAKMVKNRHPSPRTPISPLWPSPTPPSERAQPRAQLQDRTSRQRIRGTGGLWCGQGASLRAHPLRELGAIR